MSTQWQMSCLGVQGNECRDGQRLGKYMRGRYLGEAMYLKSEQHGAAIFSIEDNAGGKLGTIKWYGHWKRYCFYPCEATFSADCLREIVKFMEELW